MPKLNEATPIRLLNGSEKILLISNGSIVQFETVQQFIDMIKESIVVGGRNYISNSKERIINPNSSNSNLIHVYTFTKPGTYTLSAEIEIFAGTGYQAQALIYDVTNNADVCWFMFDDHNRKSFTFTLDKLNTNIVLYLYAGIYGSTAGVGTKWKNIKLEIGTVPTDWTPNPDD